MSASKLEYLFRAGAGKVEGFQSLGFTPDKAEMLRQILISIGQQVNLSSGTITQYGTKFEQALEVIGPNGVMGRINTVWQLDNGSSTLRLITAWVEVFIVR